MDALFHEGRGLPSNKVFPLSRQARNELQVLGILGPLAQTDLRVSYSTNLFTTDASPDGGAVCVAPVGASVAQELWRHAEQKGFHTRLQSPVSAYLEEKGLRSEAAEQFYDHHGIPETTEFSDLVPSSLHEGVLFDCVEIFRGTGAWSEAHQQMGLRVHDGIGCNGKRLRVADLTSDQTARELISLAARRVAPCPSYGV